MDQDVVEHLLGEHREEHLQAGRGERQRQPRQQSVAVGAHELDKPARTGAPERRFRQSRRGRRKRRIAAPVLLELLAVDATQAPRGIGDVDAVAVDRGTARPSGCRPSG